MMQLGAEGVFVGSGIFKSGNPEKRAAAIVKAVTNFTDAKLLAEQRAAGMKIVSLENAAVAGGLGEAIGADVKFGWPDVFIPHGTQAELERRYGLDVDAIVAALKPLTTHD
jgi:transketolase C-terminal domain/subunit